MFVLIVVVVVVNRNYSCLSHYFYTNGSPIITSAKQTMKATNEFKALKIKYNMYISRVSFVLSKVLESSLKKCKLDFLPCRQYELNLVITGCQ